MTWNHNGLSTGWRKSMPLCAMLVPFVILFAALSSSAQPRVREYDVKATFLFHFAQFVEWPTNAVAGPSFIIGIFGKDPFNGFLDKIVKGERVNGRPIEIRRYTKIEDARNAQILFISKSERRNLPALLEKLKDSPVLTVSENGEQPAASPDAIICFSTERDKIRFRINVKSAKAKELVISSKLLRLAEVVDYSTSKR